jgi:2-phospho-L-lactate/phosphoenolpyruvate guanylyltransferase
MTTLAILPVKSFTEAKRRLRRGLTVAERRALAEAMFTDVLVALRRANTLDGILVVSADHGAQQIAGGYGAGILDDAEHGHNAAARRGIRRALELQADRALLVPGDCPMLDPAQLEELLQHEIDRPSVIIVPDRHGTGTNALLLAPPDALAPSFGPGSRERHMANAREQGVNAEVVSLPSLALDVDTPDDLDALQSTLTQAHGGAPHTRGRLSQLIRSRTA